MRISSLSRILAAVGISQSAWIIDSSPAEKGLLIRDFTYETLSESSGLHKRLENQWQSFLALGGFQVSYITFAHFIPIQVAAFGLQELYQAVQITALANQITEEEVSNAVFITIGSFTLTLSSDQKIPWALLHAFAARMWEITGAGFTPGYTILFRGPSGAVLRADLRVSRVGRGASRRPPTPEQQDSG